MSRSRQDSNLGLKVTPQESPNVTANTKILTESLIIEKHKSSLPYPR